MKLSTVPYDTDIHGTFTQTEIVPSGFGRISNVLFHPFENMMVVVDSHRKIGLWNYVEMEKINSFSNYNPKGTKITSISFINSHHISLLLTGSDDGAVRLWKDPHLQHHQRIVSAWTAVENMPRRKMGLLVDWQQQPGRMIISGNSHSMQIWDVTTERCMKDIEINSDACISSICSTKDGNLVFAGCVDGTVKGIDLRNPKHPNVNAFSNKHMAAHRVMVKLQCGRGILGGKLFSANTLGDIIVSDLRHSAGSIKRMQAFDQHIRLDAFDVHNYAPVFACGSKKQIVTIMDLNGTTINTSKYYKGFMGHRIGPVTSLSFHPNKLLLAAGGYHSFISMFHCKHPSMDISS